MFSKVKRHITGGQIFQCGIRGGGAHLKFEESSSCRIVAGSALFHKYLYNACLCLQFSLNPM